MRTGTVLGNDRGVFRFFHRVPPRERLLRRPGRLDLHDHLPRLNAPRLADRLHHRHADPGEEAADPVVSFQHPFCHPCSADGRFLPVGARVHHHRIGTANPDVRRGGCVDHAHSGETHRAVLSADTQCRIAGLRDCGIRRRSLDRAVWLCVCVRRKHRIPAGDGRRDAVSGERPDTGTA